MYIYICICTYKYITDSLTSCYSRSQRLCRATDMQPPSRPPNQSDGSTEVTAREESGGDPHVDGAAGASAQTSRSNDGGGGGERSFGHRGSTGGGELADSPPRCRTKAISPLDSLGVFQKRSIFSYPRRSSSGYFSFDGESLPSSPLSPRPATADRATQTPSPTSQVMKHFLQRMTEAHGRGPGTQQLHGSSPNPSSTQQRNAAGDMQTEAVIGQELRRIGDDFNRLLLLRGVAGGHRPVVIPQQQLPHIHQEPTVLLCVGILLLVIGRIIYLQGGMNNQDHAQV
ncbi:bcl-2-like protein 11 isoform X2 [Lates calcarifer]|uniref:Bcl-2-like protein 11 isoform X2 n=1 Tax=Lates calcarifer TaxID=8187 RepID=A0A4W6EYW6_LATCA|nr:bcl-2-like protein 11 isoform X2 [Lates calcarifer]